MTEPRCINLRRPPTLSMQDTPFVPHNRSGSAVDVMDEVDRRWAAICKSRPGSYDGRLCHVLGVHRNGHGGASLHVMDCAYRFHAVQDERFDLGVRALGVKGITLHQDRVLLGRRSEQVMAYPGMWEFAPGGVVEPGASPIDTLAAELREETGLVSAGEPTPIALLYDPDSRCWEIVYRVSVSDPVTQPQTAEYDDLRWCEPGAWPTPLSPVARQIAALRALP